MARPKDDQDGWDLPPELSLEAERSGFDDKRYDIHESTEYRGTLYFPPELIPAGWKYVWANERLMNEDQPENLQELYRKGYDFVPASDHPEYVIPQMRHRFAEGKDDGNIRAKGSILMKIPEEVFNSRLKACEAEAENIRKQSSALTDYLGEAPGRFKVENDQGYSPMHVRTRG